VSGRLEVDIDALRNAAKRLEYAAAGYRAIHAGPLAPMPDGTLGQSDIAREAQAIAAQRASQSLEVATLLAGAADDLAVRLIAIATLFERAEQAHRQGISP
jgi:hypothetical protein